MAFHEYKFHYHGNMILKNNYNYSTKLINIHYMPIPIDIHNVASKVRELPWPTTMVGGRGGGVRC